MVLFNNFPSEEGKNIMPDVYTTITHQPRDVVETLAHAMETRASSSRQRIILDSYLSYISFPNNARVLEIGCGSGPITEVLAQQPGQIFYR